MKVNITKEMLEDLYVNKEMSQVEIGEIFNVDRKNIDYYLKKYGIPKRSKSEAILLAKNKKREVPIEDSMILAMLDEGALVNDIADYFNVSRGTIRRRLDDLGIPSLRNHKAQTDKQSEFMRGNNPVPVGSSRPDYIIEALADANRKYARDRWDNIDNFKQYASTARYLAYRHYGNKTLEGFEIDHIFSIKDGWDNGVDVEDISHPRNLRIVTIEENKAKHAKSLITLEQFYKLIGK